MEKEKAKRMIDKAKKAIMKICKTPDELRTVSNSLMLSVYGVLLPPTRYEPFEHDLLMLINKYAAPGEKITLHDS